MTPLRKHSLRGTLRITFLLHLAWVAGPAVTCNLIGVADFGNRIPFASFKFHACSKIVVEVSRSSDCHHRLSKESLRDLFRINLRLLLSLDSMRDSFSLSLIRRR